MSNELEMNWAECTPHHPLPRHEEKMAAMVAGAQVEMTITDDRVLAIVRRAAYLAKARAQVLLVEADNYVEARDGSR